MQPLQRSYAITEERIKEMLYGDTLSGLYDEAKVEELENAEELSGKEKNKLDNFKANKPIYDAVLEALYSAISNDIYKNPTTFKPIITKILADTGVDSKTVDKIIVGLSIMDKTADIQKDKKGNIIYDKDTKDSEIVPWAIDIDDYMEKEVLPHIPDAKWFFEEDLDKKNPVVKTGAEIPFTRYFYKYQTPTSSEDLKKRFNELEASANSKIKKLFGGK